MILIAFLMTLIVILMYYNSLFVPRLRKDHPLGPKRYPFVGSYLEVRKLRNKLGFYHLVWDHLSKLYGEVFSVKLGLIEAVIVSGYDGVRYVMQNDAFDGRPDGFLFRFRALYKRLGIVFVDGPMWTTQRKFLMRHLRRMGLGGNTTEAFINEEVDDLMMVIKKKSQNGKPVEIFGLFDVSVLNGLWTMIAGQRYALDDPKLIRLMELVHVSFRMLDMSGGILNQMPFVRFLAPKRSGYKELEKILNEFYAFLKESVDEQRLNDQDSFINAFLLEIEKEKESTDSFTEEQLLVLLLDLFMAGSETTSSTLSFIIYQLIKHPEVQTKLFEELDEVVGNRNVQLEDRNKLRYLEAVFMEVQRHSNVAPLSIAHRTVRTTKLKGYTIPNNTIVLTSIYSVHMDKNHWGDPEEFRPERFLDSNTGEIITDTWFLPFGIGRRRCPGEILAKMNLYMFVARIIQNYIMAIPDGVELPQIHQEGVTICPSPFSVNFIPRR